MSANPPLSGFTGQAFLAFPDAGGATQTFSFDNVLSEEWEDGADITEHPVEKGPDVADHIRDRLPKVTLIVHATNEPIDSNNYMQAVTGPTAIQIKRPNWVPGDGIVVVPTWQNMIGLRSDIGSLLGAAGGNGAVKGAVGALALAGRVGGLFGVTLPFFDGVEVDVPVATDAGLLPPGPAAPINVTTQTWPGGFDFVEETIARLRAFKSAAQLFTIHGSKVTEPDMAIESITVARTKEEGTGATITLGLKKIRIVETQTVAAPIPALVHTAAPSNKGAQNGSDAPPQVQQSVLSAAFDAVKSYFSKKAP